MWDNFYIVYTLSHDKELRRITMKLDITALKNSIARLTEGLARYEKDIHDEQIRDGLVQRFEFTYDQCHKMLKRYLESTAATPDTFDQADFQFMIRSGNEQGLLLGDWPTWRNYRDMRSKTSHTYDEKIALNVVQGIPKFLEEAIYLHNQLLDRLK